MYETSLIERLFREKKENSDGEISSDSEYDEALKSSKDKAKGLVNASPSVATDNDGNLLVESIDPLHDEYVKEKV